MARTKHLISIDDLDDDDLHHVVDRAARFAAGPVEHGRPLADQVVGLYFRRTSTRTRTSFWSGSLRLGAGVVNFGPDDLQTNTGETTEDTGRVLSPMLDVLVARTCGATEELRGWASWGGMSVVNAMSEMEHPTQALTDLATIKAHFGTLSGIRVAYLGEGNNSATALALAAARVPGMEVDFRTPPGYAIDQGVMARAHAVARRTGAKLSESHDMSAPPSGVDVLYTTRWQTTGTAKPDPDWRGAFAPFQVGAALWDTNPDAVFMHDLPAHRGEEVTAEVLDGPMSIAFRQATNKMWTAMAVVEWCRA
ncbi:ornithine carbamoyltransferase [Saccharothrix longispora]|uniref:ornithine carbamoyltransferase n=1 Tax=Saccharothrix longispora TaxID=33920 RepID=UPI0028FDB431|nr:ornithine carbamoyltransferase [Saccharothrix longispora]MDU0289422.1 ornithine carbamoyltransferase [Saccharothrix longispora]